MPTQFRSSQLRSNWFGTKLDYSDKHYIKQIEYCTDLHFVDSLIIK